VLYRALLSVRRYLWHTELLRCGWKISAALTGQMSVPVGRLFEENFTGAIHLAAAG